MTLNEKVQMVSQRFGQKGIRVDSDWLNGCVEFFISEDPSIAANQLYQQAEEQWELSDLCDSGVKCLPDTIFSKKESHIINGAFLVQLQQLLDISESPYDQLQKLQDKEVEIGKEQPEFKQTFQKTRKKRMFKLELTDGFGTISALEYASIPILTTKLTPGTKLILSGPIRCVNHILFLEAKNVRILGGEITNLVIENAYENVLRKKLNQPVNPNPKIDYQEATIAGDATNPSQRFDTIPAIPMTASRVIQSNVISSAITLDDEDDDFLNDIDVDQIASTAVQNQNALAAPPNALRSTTVAPSNHTNNCPTSNRRSTLLFDDNDDIDEYDLLNIDSTIEQSNAARQSTGGSGVATASTAAMISQSPPHSAESSAPHNDNAQSNTSIDDSLPIYDEKYRFKIRGINLATVRQLVECDRQHLERRKHFLVKAIVENIVQKARVSHGKWVLGVEITDTTSGNVTLETTFHPMVTEKMAGKSGREVNQLYQERDEKPQNQSEIAGILESLTTQLEVLNAFLKLEYHSDAVHPIIVEIINPAPVLDRKLQEKIQHEQLMM